MDLQTLCEWQLLSELIYFPIDTKDLSPSVLHAPF